MDDKQYQGLEKKFHQLQEKHLVDISSQNDLTHGSPASICKALVEKVGISKAEEILLDFQKSNNIELIASAYFEADDFVGSVIPIKFVDISDLYSPGCSIKCQLEVDADFAPNISKRDWVGLFEEGWKYLHSYITFEWVSLPVEEHSDKHVMTVMFNSKTLPKKPKDEGHVFCYVTRTGDVLGVSKTFHFKNPGLSFTDPDTFLVEEDMVSSITAPPITLLDLPSVTEESAVTSVVSLDTEGSESGVTPSDVECVVEAEDVHIMCNNSVQKLQSELDTAREMLEEKERQISKLESMATDIKMELDAKIKQQETTEESFFETSRNFERQLMTAELEKQNLEKLNEDLKMKIAEYSSTISEYEEELSTARKDLTDSQNYLSQLQVDMFQKTSSETSEDTAERCKSLTEEKAALQRELDALRQEKSLLSSVSASNTEEINRLKMLIKSKDDVINKLVVTKRQTDSTMVILKSEKTKHQDESKRLLSELSSCIDQLKISEKELHSATTAQMTLQNECNELSMMRNENKTLTQKVAQLEIQNKELSSMKVDLRDGDIATGIVLSLQARVAHLEHLNSQYESGLMPAVATGEPSHVTVEPVETVAAEPSNVALQMEVDQLRAQLDEKTSELEVTLRQGEEIETNFREGIKDLRGQLVRKSLELEERIEQLADKGEIIDGLRVECQERRETERSNKHRICQMEKRLEEESESYHQIISDLQSQLSGYTNSHIQFERHGLVKCPLCPAAYEQTKQDQMEDHIRRKHPF